MGEAKIPFLFVGNQRCLDFINTSFVVNGDPVEVLTTFSDLVMWLVEAELLSEEEGKKIERRWSKQEEGPETFEQARTFRATLREMVERIADGRPVPQAAMEAINGLLRYRIGYPQVTRRNGKFEQDYLADSQEANQVLGLLGEAAMNLLCTCEHSLIKKCQNPLCVLFFYDTTKNHTRHWCSMTLCGNRSKVAAHYRRHRSQST